MLASAARPRLCR